MNIKNNRTIIVISHNKENLSKCDVVYKLKNKAMLSN